MAFSNYSYQRGHDDADRETASCEELGELQDIAYDRGLDESYWYCQGVLEQRNANGLPVSPDGVLLSYPTA